MSNNEHLTSTLQSFSCQNRFYPTCTINLVLIPTLPQFLFQSLSWHILQTLSSQFFSICDPCCSKLPSQIYSFQFANIVSSKHNAWSQIPEVLFRTSSFLSEWFSKTRKSSYFQAHSAVVTKSCFWRFDSLAQALGSIWTALLPCAAWPPASNRRCNFLVALPFQHVLGWGAKTLFVACWSG